MERPTKVLPARQYQMLVVSVSALSLVQPHQLMPLRQQPWYMTKKSGGFRA